jgi:hypothetical protein
MPSKIPLPIVSAAVTPAIAEEIQRMARANRVTRSTMVRQLLEERLTQRANERMEDANDRLEKRLKYIEERFSSLIVKGMRASAQTLYLTMKGLETGHMAHSNDGMTRHWQDSQEFAGTWLKGKSKTKSEE